jgi:hypothetical protein
VARSQPLIELTENKSIVKTTPSTPCLTDRRKLVKKKKQKEKGKERQITELSSSFTNEIMNSASLSR